MDNIKDNSIALVYKPKGITSFDVIRIVKKNTDVKKIGHAGTLDPNAEGLMILGTGTHTKKLAELVGLDKTYIAEIKLGIQTDTGDITGKIIAERKNKSIDHQKVQAVIKELKGTHTLPVSLFSAIKKDGKPLYKYAREGKNIENPVREMIIHSSSLIDYKHPIITAEFDVSSGTYIRSISEEIGQKLGTVGTLSNLKRTKVGNFSVEDVFIIPGKILKEFTDNKKQRKL